MAFDPRSQQKHRRAVWLVAAVAVALAFAIGVIAYVTLGKLENLLPRKSPRFTSCDDRYWMDGTCPVSGCKICQFSGWRSEPGCGPNCQLEKHRNIDPLLEICVDKSSPDVFTSRDATYHCK